MRVVAVHADALLLTSRLWQTNALVLRGRAPERPAGEPGLSLPLAGGAGGAGDGPGGAPEVDKPAGGAGKAGEPAGEPRGHGGAGEAMLIDSPYFPDELEALPAVLGQAGFRVDALLATHADFDHLLGRLAFPELALGVAESTAERLRAEPGVAQRELRDADDAHYVARPAPLRLGDWQALPVPGRLELAGDELELHPAEGHTADGMAVLARRAGVLACGDYLSGVEIPMLSPGGSLAAYRATLARLAPLVEAAGVVVPGHGPEHARADALRILDEDADYLDALEAGEERARLPAGRDTRRQREIHAENLRRTA